MVLGMVVGGVGLRLSIQGKLVSSKRFPGFGG